MAARGSLRLRLLVGAAVAIFIALAIAWGVMGFLFSRHAQRGVVIELTREALELVGALQMGANGAPFLDGQQSDPRFDRPNSGRYWQATSAHGMARSLSLWDENLPSTSTTSADRWITREVAGPFGQEVVLLERAVQIGPSDTRVVVQVAQNLSDLRAAGSAFRRELGVFLVVLWFALVLAAWLQVKLGLKPLQKVRHALSSLHRNPAARLDTSHPREVAPLVEAINELADSRERDLVRAKRRGADLAHSLKTPLSALRAISHRARAAGSIDTANDLDRVIAAAAAALEAELARSRAAAIRESSGDTQCAPKEVSERIIGVVQRTESGSRLVFDVEVDDGMTLPIAADNLMEVLGALIENAARHARRRVRVSANVSAGSSDIAVEDDGPGLEISEEEALMRGMRLDEAGHGGHGLGLSIAKEITEATGGVLSLGRSSLGGLRVSLRWERGA